MKPTARKQTILGMMLGSIGVVYGDIGTSPLYAFRESLAAAGYHANPDPMMVLGVLSLILWTLFIIVTCKYVLVLLRADNQGEGGILSLMALVQKAIGGKGWVLLLGMVGAALFYGDAMITPAISVLSALEGLKLVTPHFTPYILPIAFLIMIILFVFQKYGTAKVAILFGPLMLAWFVAMGWGGLRHAADSPAVWGALNPYYAFYFISHFGFAAIIALGAVFLSVTGAEALYADLGHFGKRAIRLAWLWCAMPALMLNYFGQAALVLAQPEAVENSFFLLYPDWALLPMVILATFATIIASQAVITGAFSLTHQAVQLGILPRLRVLNTSENHVGQIYMPQVNWILLGGVILLIEVFRSSSALASAYGIAVTGTMVITTILLAVVMRRNWQLNIGLLVAVIAPLLVIEAIFLGANFTKFFHGGYVPVLFSVALVLMMRIWVRGSETLHKASRDYQNSMDGLITSLNHYPPKRVGGSAVFLTSNPVYAPTALLQNLKHNKVLHEQNILLTLEFVGAPRVEDSKRLTLTPLCDDFTRAHLRFGYMENANVTKGISLLREAGIVLDMMDTSFFISRRTIVPSAKFGMKLWQDRIYIFMANNATDAADYFHIPQSRVVELGVQVTV